VNGKATAILGALVLGLSSWALLSSVSHGQAIVALQRDRSDVERLELRVDSLEELERQNREWVLERTRDRFTVHDAAALRAEIDARLLSAGIK
jgi:hypothetical protein